MPTTRERKAAPKKTRITASVIARDVLALLKAGKVKASAGQYFTANRHHNPDKDLLQEHAEKRRQVQAMTNREQIAKILTSPDFTDGEKFVVRAQYRATIPMGNFEEKLWEVMAAADVSNLARLAMGFPEQVKGMMAWRESDLGYRLRAHGLDI